MSSESIKENKQEPESRGDFEEYMLQIQDKISEFHSDLQADIEMTNFQYPSALLLSRIKNMNFSEFRIPSYLDYSWRLTELKKLRDMLERNKSTILDAMTKDYAMNSYEAEMFEFNPVISDLNNIINNLKSWTETSLDMNADDFAGNSNFANQVYESLKTVFGFGNELRVFNQPVGVVLIIGTKRPDLSTLIKPLIASIAAGNYNVIKPNVSKIEGGTNALIKSLLKQTLDPRRSFIIEGDVNYEELITKDNIDLVFLRRKDSTKQIINLCGQRGIPVKVHSAGWNVGIVSRSANVKEAAELLVHNKFYKSGQNNDNLDVIYIHESVYQAFLIEAKNALYKFYTQTGNQNMTYGRIVNKEDFSRLINFLDKNDHKGEYETSIYHNKDIFRINPILIKNPKSDSTLMNEKIFGPILPLRTYSNVAEVAPQVNKHSHVENVYYFGLNTYLHDDVKMMFKYQNLYLNCTNFPFHIVDYAPDFGRDSTLNCNLHGVHGFQTFSNQKLFFSVKNSKKLLKKNFLTNQLNYGVNNRGLNKFISRYRVSTVAYGLAIGYLMEKYLL